MADEDEPASTRSSFPSDPAEFDADPRISFDKANGKFILETEDEKGEALEFEFDDALKRWIPAVGFGEENMFAALLIWSIAE